MNYALVQPQQHAPGAVPSNLNICRVDHNTQVDSGILHASRCCRDNCTTIPRIFSHRKRPNLELCRRDAFNQDTDTVLPMCPLYAMAYGL